MNNSPLSTHRWHFSHPFRFDPQSKLTYLLDPAKNNPAVPSFQKITVRRMAHDGEAHAGIQRTYRFLHPFTFFRTKAFVTDYIEQACPGCTASKIKKQRPNGDLQRIDIPSISISVLCMDFILGFPMSVNGNGCLSKYRSPQPEHVFLWALGLLSPISHIPRLLSATHRAPIESLTSNVGSVLDCVSS